MSNIKLTREMVPANATHPGVLLKDELSERKIKQVDFAKNIGIAPNVLSEIITGKRNITPALAIKLEAALTIDAEYWMRIQIKFEFDTIRIRHKKELMHSKISPEKRLSMEKAINPV